MRPEHGHVRLHRDLLRARVDVLRRALHTRVHRLRGLRSGPASLRVEMRVLPGVCGPGQRPLPQLQRVRGVSKRVLRADSGRKTLRRDAQRTTSLLRIRAGLLQRHVRQPLHRRQLSKVRRKDACRAEVLQLQTDQDRKRRQLLGLRGRLHRRKEVHQRALCMSGRVRPVRDSSRVDVLSGGHPLLQRATRGHQGQPAALRRPRPILRLGGGVQQRHVRLRPRLGPDGRGPPSLLPGRARAARVSRLARRPLRRGSLLLCGGVPNAVKSAPVAAEATTTDRRSSMGEGPTTPPRAREVLGSVPFSERGPRLPLRVTMESDGEPRPRGPDGGGDL